MSRVWRLPKPVQSHSWRLYTLSWLTLLFLALCMTAQAALAADEAPDEQWVQLLTRMQQAASQQNYAGVFTYQQGEMMQSSRLTHISNETGEHERLEILDGQPREYLRHNDEVQCLIPEHKVILLERRRGDRFPGLLLGEPATLLKQYTINIDSTRHRVAGRECRLIALDPRDKLRYGYRLCADVETGLLLKAQTLNAARGIVEQVFFSSLRLGADVDPQQLLSQWRTDDWTVLKAAITPVDLAAQGWRIQMPKGFVITMQVKRSMGPEKSAEQLVMSDGLAAISVFIEPYNSQSEHPVLPGAIQHGSLAVYSKRVADFWLTAVGEVPLGTLNALLTSTEYMPTAVVGKP